MRRFGEWDSLILAGIALAGAAGCSDRPDTGAIPAQEENRPRSLGADDQDLALVRVVNAIPGSTPVTIFAGDSAVFTGIGYKNKTKFLAIPDELSSFKLGSADQPLAENRQDLVEGGYYTIVATPEEGGDGKLGLRVLEEDRKSFAADKARVRIIHAIPGEVDLSLSLAGREDPLFEGIGFNSEAGWIEVEPMAGTLEVREQGKGEVLASLPSTKLESGRSYTFVIAGQAAGPEIIILEDEIPRM